MTNKEHNITITIDTKSICELLRNTSEINEKLDDCIELVKVNLLNRVPDDGAWPRMERNYQKRNYF